MNPILKLFLEEYHFYIPYIVMFTASSLVASTDFTSLAFQMLSLTPNSADFTSVTGIAISSLSIETISECPDPISSTNVK